MQSMKHGDHGCQAVVLHRATEAYGQAEPLYQRALVIAEKALGPEHPDSPASPINDGEMVEVVISV